MRLWDNALNGLSEKMIEENLENGTERTVPMAPTDRSEGYGTRHWIKWCAISAAVLMLIAGLSMLPGWLRQNRGPIAISTSLHIEARPTAAELATAAPCTTVSGDAWLEKEYRTRIEDSVYQSYQATQFCEAQYVGDLLGTVTVEAGWQNGAGEYLGQPEQLKAQVYSLKPVRPEIAVCLKFLDKGEALTTEHYYVYHAPDSGLDIMSLGAHLGWWTWPPEAPEGEGSTVTGYTMPVPTTGATIGE